jgi:hypothetical protein
MADNTMSCSLGPAVACDALCAEPEELPPGPERAAQPPAALPPAALRTSEQVVHAPRVTLPLVDTAEECAGKLGAVALALLASGNPLVRVLGGLKAGLEIGACAADTRAEQQTQADHRAAIEQCLAHAGTPMGFVDDTLTCLVPPGRGP